MVKFGYNQKKGVFNLKKIATVFFLSFLLLVSSVTLDSKEASAIGGTVINTYSDLYSPTYRMYTNLTYKDITWKNGFTRTKSSGKQIYSTYQQMIGYSGLKFTYSYYTY